MIIDFQKAFDSISWNFIYNTLSFLGFGENYIKWIKLLNNKVTARVIQSGYSSSSIQIGRGCRQGDPISPYLYIIAYQILTLLILHNPDIKGIFIKGTEFKIAGYADDMTLLYPRREAGKLWIHHCRRPRPHPHPQRFLVSDLQSTFLSRFLSYLAGGLIW